VLVSRIRANDVVNFCLGRKSSKMKPSASTISIDDRAIVDAYPALQDLQLIARSIKRDRRLTQHEFEMLHLTLLEKQNHHCCFIPYGDIFLISILTFCRVSEVCNLRWFDKNRLQKSILVRDRKNPNGSFGNNSTIPLLGESLNILLRQKKTDPRIFPFNPRSIGAGFRRATRKLNLEDLRYHDLRREGASRLIEQGYSVEEVARVTGHRDLNVLWQVYVNIRPEHFIEKHSHN
jgi:integrase